MILVSVYNITIRCIILIRIKKKVWQDDYIAIIIEIPQNVSYVKFLFSRERFWVRYKFYIFFNKSYYSIYENM